MAYLGNLVKEPVLHARVGDAPIRYERYIVQHWPIDADLGGIRDALCSWIIAVDDSSKRN
jgi:hypothetical protein